MEIRRLKLEDNLEIVSELIYYSDNYIYPTLFSSLDEAKRILTLFIKSNTIFNYKNILVALIDDEIAGVVVLMPKFPINNYNEMLKSIKLANCDIPKNFAWVNREYFETLNFNFDGTYIVSLCVNDKFRRRKVGTTLLNSLPYETYSLAAVKDNYSAVELYKKCGFEIVYEYSGFIGVPCVEMVRGVKK